MTVGQPAREQSSTTTYPFRELWQPLLTVDENGNTCIDGESQRLGREPSATEFAQVDQQMLLYLRQYDLCPDVELPQTTPAQEAAAFLQRVGLPVPTPAIRPSALPVGLESFLETGAPTSRTYGPVPTPFGDLVLTATAEVYVDWDDPHDDVDGEHGPYGAEPGPYPDGGITHVYQYDGFYEITVRYAWTAAWQIGPHEGTIEGMETTGAYPAPGFEAFSHEAVG